MQSVFRVCEISFSPNILFTAMTRLTASICCFGLSALFAWISGSASSAALKARAHATYAGAALMMRQPMPNTGLADFAMLASILMLIIGVGCLIAAMLGRKTTQLTTPPASSK